MLNLELVRILVFISSLTILVSAIGSAQPAKENHHTEKLYHLFSPSLICGDLNHFEDTIKASEYALGIKSERTDDVFLKTGSLHLDIFDGDFAESEGFTISQIQRIRKMVSVPLQIHLMSHQSADVVTKLSKILRPNFDTIIVHIEARDSATAIQRVIENKILLGLALRIDTSFADAIPQLSLVSTLLLFTVRKVGQRGQSIDEQAYKRIAAIKRYLSLNSLNIELLVDGGVYENSIRALALAGATRFVVGSAFFGSDAKGDPNQLREKLEAQLYPSE